MVLVVPSNNYILTQEVGGSDEKSSIIIGSCYNLKEGFFNYVINI